MDGTPICGHRGHDYERSGMQHLRGTLTISLQAAGSRDKVGTTEPSEILYSLAG
jgi:hypothetical protein